MKTKLLILIFSALFLWESFGCSKSESPYAKGNLEIQFSFNKPAGDMQPSYQIAIWLEDLKGLYIKSLFVSEYLSYGGYNDSTICPLWSKKSNWNDVSEVEFNAVTQATPGIGLNKIQINCIEHKVPTGKYHYVFQAHIQERYNITYRGEIEFGKNSDEDSGKVEYYPERHPDAGEILSDVLVKYIN